MTDSTTSNPTTEAIYKDASGYWKLCTCVLGLGFLIAIAANTTPNSASAHEPTNLLAFHQSQAAAIKAADADQQLKIGGFDSVNGNPVFVIVNENGQQVGTLPMSSIED
ncbi:MAG: hypothetical protein P1U42_06445 [Phycisphaerales bacterium]|nr:hypothetical protein [Phycisphaerales bacterium]